MPRDKSPQSGFRQIAQQVVRLDLKEANMRKLSRCAALTFAALVILIFPQLSFAQQSGAQKSDSAACNQATPEPVVDVSLPGHPFMAVATPDGCWIFASMRGGGTAQSGVAVIQRM